MPLEAISQAGNSLDLTSKLYENLRGEATPPWSREDRFSLDPESSLIFQTNLDMRLSTIGINSGSSSAVHFKDNKGRLGNILFSCHTVSKETLVLQMRDFINGVRKNETIAQTADLLYHVIWNGLTNKARQRLSAYCSKFVQGTIDSQGRSHVLHNGPLLLKSSWRSQI